MAANHSLLHDLSSTLVLLLLFCYSQAGVSGLNTIRHLPGFKGHLPFSLETGYVNVDEANDVQLFYYFIQSERNPKIDPLIVWITGGPGCSALSGLLFEIGPLQFDVAGYTEGLLPSLLYRQSSWTQVANIIFLDSPVGTGFSYSSTPQGQVTSDTISSNDVCTFIKKWYADHPSFISNPLYIGGDSYSGLVVPVIAQYIAEGRAQDGLQFNLKGYLVGNPSTEFSYDGNAKIPYAHGMGLISDELYEATKKSCKGEYLTPGNAECESNLEAVNQGLFGINNVHILEPLCFFASPKPGEVSTGRRELLLEENFKVPLLKADLPLSCRSSAYMLSYLWTNNDTVRQVLGIHKGTKPFWIRCNYGINFTNDVPSSLQYHFSLTSNGYRALVYSGDHDMTVPYLGTQAWIRSLNFSIVDDWRSWWVDNQIAGFTRRYSNNLTFVTIKGGGHTAPEYLPRECLMMVDRWLSEVPL
ncbi:serine carboxypeptidase-like 1 [Curcuma longa]|uniref:serine carboxypeptidase-like 1 n=1 Tax=Curcuma longa TaxID=136217 RepID=UPI003D9F3AE6